MLARFVGLIATSTSLSPLSAGPSLDTFARVWNLGVACAADVPKTSASPATATASKRALILRLPRRPSRKSTRLLPRLGGDLFCSLEQLVPREQLDARTPELLARSPLALVDRGPAGIEDRSNPTLGEQGLDRVGSGRLPVNDPPGVNVLEQERHGLGGVLLVRPDDPGRPALDPAGAIDAGQMVAVAEDPA